MQRPLFSPPPFEIDADLAWLLRSAFARVPPSQPPNEPVRALRIARDTELSGRIAKRLGPYERTADARSLYQSLEADYHANAAKEALLAQAWREVAKLAASRGVPVIAVKFAALRLANVVAPGTRVVSDVDVLLRKADAKPFWHALLGAGFRRTHTHGYAHQLEALVGPYGAVVDLHVHLPGVILEKGGFATADQLMARGLVTPSHSSLLVPQHALLAAHAVAHALAQNRSTPQTYSPLRMVADVMDLRHAQPDVLRAAIEYLAPELAPMCQVLQRLCDFLSEGRLGGDELEGSDEQTLLRHCIAARLDSNYGEQLRAGGLAYKFRDGSSPLDIARYIAELLYPSTPAMDVLYGPAVGPLARIRRRLFRPLDLTLRAARRWRTRERAPAGDSHRR